MTHLLGRLPIHFCIATVLAGAGSVRADEALPSQDKALARALENHPDIVAAKAKVAMAEAELYGKRIEVSRHVLGLYGSLKILDAQIDASKAALNGSKTQFEQFKDNSAVDQSTKDKHAAEVHAAEAQVVQTIGQREQAEKELRLLIGTASSAADSKTPRKATAVARQTPQGPVVEKMKTALEKPMKLDFAEIPVAETLAYFTDKSGIMFSLQREALEAAGIGTDQPISLHTSEVPLHAALQAFQDSYPDLQFVLRDYGVLVTTKDSSEEHGYSPVLEMGKESATTFKSR